LDCQVDCSLTRSLHSVVGTSNIGI
jgi:hypothetical protein